MPQKGDLLQPSRALPIYPMIWYDKGRFRLSVMAMFSMIFSLLETDAQHQKQGWLHSSSSRTRKKDLVTTFTNEGTKMWKRDYLNHPIVHLMNEISSICPHLFLHDNISEQKLT